MVRQSDWLLRELMRGRTITPICAMEEAGVGRLAARVNDLRSMGYPVITDKRRVRNRYGKPVYIAAYRMEKP